MMTFDCPRCGKNTNLPDKYAGTEMICRNCKAMITVPDVSSERIDTPTYYDTSAIFMTKNYALLQALLEYERKAPPVEMAP
jgi:transcription elongation factor Elf1